MGLLVAAADIGRETFTFARWVTRPIRGGLGIANVAPIRRSPRLLGSSIASATVFAKIASTEMIRHGYYSRFAAGAVSGSSVLGMLLPPSLLLIVYGFFGGNFPRPDSSGRNVRDDLVARNLPTQPRL